MSQDKPYEGISNPAAYADFLRRPEAPWAELCSNGTQIYWQTSAALWRMPLGRYCHSGSKGAQS